MNKATVYDFEALSIDGKPALLGSSGVKWNFTKFLVGRDGQVLNRYAPNDTPGKPAARH